MNPSSQDIKDMLVADSSLGLVYGTNLFIGKEVAQPINQVIIFDTSGMPTSLGLNDHSYEYPSIQIRIRNKSYTEAMKIAYDIKTVLYNNCQTSWNGTLYSVIYCASGPALLDWDENGNPNIIINFNINRR